MAIFPSGSILISPEQAIALNAIPNRTVLVLVSISAVAVALSGCSNAEFYQQKVDTARVHLQVSEDEQALDVLSVPNDSSAPPEFHYLKAVTLDRLGRTEAAMAEIKRATEASPNHPKYKGLELKLRLFARDRGSIDQLIKLNQDFASVGAVALFATYAFQAKSILLDAENKPKAATFHHERKLQTLDTALTLAKDIPELQRELITFAIQNHKLDDALRLINGMLELAPKSIPIRNQKIQILLQARQSDEAALIAKHLFNETGRQLSGAEAYAAVLSQASPTPENDEAFAQLRESFSRSPAILCKYAVYLTRSGRMLLAHKLLDEAISKQQDKSVRESLAYISITLPLEIGSAEYAEERLRQYRPQITDPLLIDYFEARILYLRRQTSEAIQKMLSIVEAEKKNPGKSTVLAAEALSWIRRILADRVLTEQIGVAISTAQQSTQTAPNQDAKDQKPGEAKPVTAEPVKPNDASTEPEPQNSP